MVSVFHILLLFVSTVLIIFSDLQSSFFRAKKKSAAAVAASSAAGSSTDYTYSFSFSRHGKDGRFCLASLNQGPHSLKLPAKFQSDMRNTWKDASFMNDMASADCVVFNSFGLDRRESRESDHRMEVIAEKGNNKGQAFGVPCFSFLYDGENTGPDHSKELIKKVSGIVKKHHCRAYKKNPNTRYNPRYHELDVEIDDTSVLLPGEDNTWQPLDFVLSDKAAVYCVLSAADPVTAHDKDTGEDVPLKSKIVTAYENDEIVRSLISPHPTTGAYSPEAVAQFGFPFDDCHSVDDIKSALSYLVDECDLVNAEDEHMRIILARLNSAMEAGIIDKSCEDALGTFMKRVLDVQTKDSVLSMTEVGTFRDLVNNLTYKKRKVSVKESSMKQQKITDSMKRRVTKESDSDSDNEADASDTESVDTN